MQVCPVLALFAALSSVILTYCNFLPSGFLEVPLGIHHLRIRFLNESHRFHMECASTCNPTLHRTRTRVCTQTQAQAQAHAQMHAGN